MSKKEERPEYTALRYELPEEIFEKLSPAQKHNYKLLTEIKALIGKMEYEGAGHDSVIILTNIRVPDVGEIHMAESNFPKGHIENIATVFYSGLKVNAMHRRAIYQALALLMKDNGIDLLADVFRSLMINDPIGELSEQEAELFGKGGDEVCNCPACQIRREMIAKDTNIN